MTTQPQLLIDFVGVITHPMFESEGGEIKAIVGKFQQSFKEGDAPNKNGRKYPPKIWDQNINNQNSEAAQRLKAGGMIGFAEHPSDGVGKINEAAILTTNLKVAEDGTVQGKAKFTSTLHGQSLKALAKDGVRLGISSRGMGVVGPDGVVTEYVLKGFDVVSEPSTEGAFVRPVPESVNPKTVSVEDKTMSLDKYRVLESQVKEALTQPLDTLQPYQRTALSNSLIEISQRVGELAKGDSTIAVEASSLQSSIAARRKEIAEFKPTTSVGESVPAKTNDGAAKPVNLEEENKSLRELLKRAKDDLKEQTDVAESSGKLADETIAKLTETEKRAETAEADLKAFKDLTAMYCVEVDTVEVRQAVESAIKQHPSLKKVQGILDRLTSAEEVNALVESMNLTKTSTSDGDALPTPGKSAKSDDLPAKTATADGTPKKTKLPGIGAMAEALKRVNNGTDAAANIFEKDEDDAE